MAEKSKENVKTKSSIKEISIKEEDTDAEKKNKLLMEIRTLKLLMMQMECKFVPTKFKDLQDGMCKTQSILACSGTSRLLDVNSMFRKDLCVYAGFFCEKMDDEFIFTFSTYNEKICEKKRCIQLFKDEEGWRLGCWTMPLGLDVRAIFAKYSMDSHNDIKYFLRECKHLLACHNRREHEFRMLQTFMNHMQRYGCSVETHNQYTVTTMKLIMKRNSALDMRRNILVYLTSKKDGVTPTKIKIDSDDDNELSDDWRKKLRQFFNCFKEMSLINAASCTLASPDSPFFWKDASKDDSIIESEEANGMNNSSLLQLLQKKSRALKKRRRDSTEVNESPMKKRKNDLSSEIIESSEPEVCDGETPPVTNRKSKKPKLETTKGAKPAAKNSTAKKTNIAKRGKAEIVKNAHEKGENNSNTLTSDQPDLEICEVVTIDIKNRNDKSKPSIAKETNPVTKNFIAKKTNGLTINDREIIPVEESADLNETTQLPEEQYSPLKDCNDNFENSNLKKNSRKASEKSSKNNSEVQATVPQLFKLQRRVGNPAPAETNVNPSTHSVKPKLAGPKSFHLQKQRSIVPSTKINGNAVKTPKARSINRLLSSTPILESTALSAITEENISAIMKENTIAPEIIIDADENKRANNRSIILDSDESDENDITEIVNDHAALLKDLQDVKYNNTANNKGAIKSVKQHIKYPSRGRKKISKK